MSSRHSRKLRLAAAWTLMLGAGGLAGWGNWVWHRATGGSSAGMLAFAALEGALCGWLLLGLPFGGWLVLRRQAEQRQALRNLSEAIEQSHSAVMIVDLAGRVEYVNRGVCDLFGYNRASLIGAAWRDLAAAQPPGAGVTEVLATARSGRRWEGEWTGRREDGTEYTARGAVAPVKRRDGSVSCFAASFDDVTDARRREAELREARDLAEAADRAKGQFLATMSHEVRTPLNGIAGFTSLLLESELTSEQRDCVQTIKMSTDALIQLTGDVLDFARIESGKLTLDPIACDPRECVEEALDFLATRAAEKRVELLHRIAGDVPAAVVIDGGRLRQVLVNLIGNAVKFTHKGEVEVSVRRREADAGGNGSAGGACTLEFTVRDTGIGIAPEHHAKLFRPFSQVDESTTRRYGGTGLGLAICRNLVGLMGGEISLSSEPGLGSRFTFAISAPVAAAQPPAPDLGGLRIGLVVRTRLLRNELADLIRSWHGEPIEADSPEELAEAGRNCTLVEFDDEMARDVPIDPTLLAALPPATSFGLVPITLPTALRNGLRAHVRLLVNKPVHHRALFSLLSGTQVAAEMPVMPTHFGFRVLLLEENGRNERPTHPALEQLGCTPIKARSGHEAVAHLSRAPHDFDLMVVDWPAAATETAEAIHDIRAGKAGQSAQTMWIIALTAAPETMAPDAGLNDSLPKIFELSQLEAALRRFRSERLARKH